MVNSQKGTVRLFIPILIFVLVAGSLYYLLTNSRNNATSTENTPTPKAGSPTPTATDSVTEPSTLDWEEYSSSSFVYQNSVYTGYTIKYPPTCSRANSILTCSFTNGTGVIEINAGGHGMGPAEIRVIRARETKSIPAGKGEITLIELVESKTIVGTYWINKTDKLTQEPIFGFEFRDIPVEDLPEFEQTLNLILSTFKFLE